MYIYLILIINIIISIVKFSKKHHETLRNLKSLTFDYNYIFIIITLGIFILGLFSFIKSAKKIIKEFLSLILSIVISFLIVPYFINNILILILIIFIVTVIYIFFIPEQPKTKTKSKPQNIKSDKITSAYIKGKYVYDSDGSLLGHKDELDQNFVNSLPKVK